ncbi:hypothetical protein ACIQD1_30980 [Streptomyces sp. NPDC093088]|uniref:hypothetical protein n=1 Tax=Streptomyces sp. NPDC093088 TaxID=3366023 RepID=UPI0037F47438
MSTTTTLVLLFLFITGFAVLAAPAYLVWRHPRPATPLGLSVACGALFAAAVGAALKL